MSAIHFSTARLIMRPPQKSDIKILASLWRCEKVRKYLGGTLQDENVIHNKIENIIQHWHEFNFGYFIVLSRFNSEMIGICGLSSSASIIEINYMFLPHYWGQGFAKEASYFVLSYGFELCKLEKISAVTQKLNMPSRKLLSNLGFKNISQFIQYNEEQCLYEITNTQWLQLQSDKFSFEH